MAMTLRADKGAILSWNEMDANFRACLGVHNFLHVQDQKNSGVGGGATTAGSWLTRTLNTVVTNNIFGANLNNNSITLNQGTYYIDAKCPAYRVKSFCSRVYKTSGTPAPIIYGSQSFANDTEYVNPQQSLISGVFDLSQNSIIEIQMYGTYAASPAGFGVAGNIGTEIYTDVKIWKLS